MHIKVSVASLAPATKEGYLDKGGGSLRFWKKKYFVLKGKNLFYFKSNKALEANGMVILGNEAKIIADTKRNAKNSFTVITYQKTLLLSASSENQMKEWMDLLIEAQNGQNDQKWQPAESAPAKAVATIKGKLMPIRECIPYLQDLSSKIVEFWDIWIESIPPIADLPPYASIDVQIATSASMQKMTWRMAGPQGTLVQKMVDFFWDVGSPETEIDRLNDVGGFIQPAIIGSWIDMSAKGGMDGGWFFTLDAPIPNALEAADPGHTSRTVLEWIARHGLKTCFLVGRDMGSSPPRQTEIRIRLQGDYETQVSMALDAFATFDFPSIPPAVQQIIEEAEPENLTINPLCMSVLISNVGFVRLGLLIPKPDPQIVNSLCLLAPEASIKTLEQIAMLESAAMASGPTFIEYQYIVAGFGYSVYQEGFDVVLHYNVPPLK